MKQLNPRRAKLLKAIHITCIVFWFGGVLSWMPLVFSPQQDSFPSAYTTHLNMRAIAFNVIGWGGIGSLLTGLSMALLTRWSLIKHRWVTVKFCMTIALVLFGMFFMEQRMLANIVILEAKKETALANPIYLSNLAGIRAGLIILIVVFFTVVLIAIFKPWMKPNEQNQTVI